MGKLLSLISVLLCGLLAVNGCTSNPILKDPPTAGGVVDNSTNAPTTIKSTELISCSFEFLLEYMELPMEDGKRPYPSGDYAFYICEKDGMAACTMRYRGSYDENSRRDLEFTTDRSALDELEKVIRDADVARDNGHSKVNSALGVSIMFDARYASDEKITIYAEGGASTVPDHLDPKPLFDWFTALAVEKDFRSI